MIVDNDTPKPPAGWLPHEKLEVKAPPPAPPSVPASAASVWSSPPPQMCEMPPPPPLEPHATYAVLPEKFAALQMNIDDKELAMDPQPFLEGNAAEQANSVLCRFFPGEAMWYFPGTDPGQISMLFPASEVLNSLESL